MRENTDKPVVFSFGRMNPPTLGHAKLINKIIWVANKEGGIPMIFASRTEDKKKNPLSFKTKIAVLKDVYGNIINTDRSIKTPFAALDALNKKGYKKVIFVVGSDRVNEFKRNMSRYVDSDLDNIQDIYVVTAGERDPDEVGLKGMSGSKLREFVMKGQFGKFKEGLMTKNSRLAKAVFKEIGKKLKTTKEI